MILFHPERYILSNYLARGGGKKPVPSAKNWEGNWGSKPVPFEEFIPLSPSLVLKTHLGKC